MLFLNVFVVVLWILALNFFLASYCFGICYLQALPIYLDKLFNQYVAIVLSVTFVLAFGEV